MKAELYPDLAPGLIAAEARIVDLLPVALACWYHPEQRGSGSIKRALPSLVPELRYDAVALRAYCAFNTGGLVHVFRRLVDGKNGIPAGAE